MDYLLGEDILHCQSNLIQNDRYRLDLFQINVKACEDCNRSRLQKIIHVAMP